MADTKRELNENNRSFIFYRNWEKIFDELSDTQAGKLIKMIFAYANRGEEAECKGVVRLAMVIIADQLDRDGKKYDTICERNSENGRKGGRPKKEQPEQSEQPENNVSEQKKTDRFSEKPKKADIDIDNKNKNDIDIESENKNEPAVSAAATRSRFEKPSVNDIIRYCYENKYPIDAQAFCDYYESVGWRVGNKPMKDWRAAVRTWVRREQSGGNVHQPAFTSSTPQSSPQPEPEPVFEDYLGILAAVRESS